MKKPILLGLLLVCSIFCKAQQPCDQIEKYVDEFRNTITYSSPYHPDYLTNIWITKVKQDKKQDYYVHIRQMEPLGKSVKGAFLILENGKRINRPNVEIQVDVDQEEVSILHPGYVQQADIKLTQPELLILKSSPISKFAISYLNDSYKGGDLYQIFNCLLLK